MHSLILFLVCVVGVSQAQQQQEDYDSFEEENFSSRLGLIDGRGLFSFTKPVYVDGGDKHKEHHDVYHHESSEESSEEHRGWPEKNYHGSGGPEHHLIHPPKHRPYFGWRQKSKKPIKKPHYVKYWAQNKAPKHYRAKKPKDWKLYKPNPIFSGYWTDLAERLAEGVGVLPEYGKDKHPPVGKHQHGKYIYKGITYHNGFFTEIL